MLLIKLQGRAALIVRSTDSAKNLKPTVLDSVVRASPDQFSDLGPFVPMQLVAFGEDSVLLCCPSTRLEFGTEVILPSSPALLASFRAQILSNQRPFLRSVFVD